MRLVKSSSRQVVKSASIFCLLLACCFLLLARPASAQTPGSRSIVNSKHNLSASGPGGVKATSESEICIFCHTPHNATPVQPLWNRLSADQLGTSYKVYTSNSLKAQPHQPTGTSKLCLSCHDGTIALGSVNSRNQPIQMAAGVTTIPHGATNLGTDLSDDHPISFVYDSDLVVKNPKLKQPGNLPANFRLDSARELQCTTCHDAHNNQYGAFLVAPNTTSQLCNTCHTMGQTEVAQHNYCNSCHKTHSAPSGPYLLRQAKVDATCLPCHDGTPSPDAGPNVNAALVKTYNHGTKPAVNLPNHEPDNVDCKDCHEPHTVRLPATVEAPTIQSTLGKINGVTIAGGDIAAAQYEYEVCFKCHADKAATLTPRITRYITQPNERLKFAPTAISYHPVAQKGKNLNVPSLRPPYTVNSIIYCTDCHGSETSKKAGGSGPNGPHGSSFPGMLVARYDTEDFTSYSTAAYALCFKCHDNTKIVIEDRGVFTPHYEHIVNQQTPCSVCHDSHGVPSAQGTNNQNFGLINFDTKVVFPIDAQHPILFNRTSEGHGQCTLKCHNKLHNSKYY